MTRRRRFVAYRSRSSPPSPWPPWRAVTTTTSSLVVIGSPPQVKIATQALRRERDRRSDLRPGARRQRLQGHLPVVQGPRRHLRGDRRRRRQLRAGVRGQRARVPQRQQGRGLVRRRRDDRREVQRAARSRRSCSALEPTKAVDTNSLVVTKATADEEQLDEDLRPDLGRRSSAAPQDCPTNAGCIPALKAKLRPRPVGELHAPRPRPARSPRRPSRTVTSTSP